ncbi:hypothetical protein C5167_009651 [Papaver somniferum]|uniref:Hexosyltransferase n=1 Tax=Papaver somniferum TaxID=3469 RepID=A0A4Y7K1Z4_PAPSO|nr:probable galacturonosyltransferase 4 [Papaver somniferum]RZC65968.1 hypothetical protein C5167_009651 [Papaver somniferum]
MKLRKPVLFLLFLTVLAPIVLYTDKLVSSSKNDFGEEVSSLSFGVESRQLNLLPEEIPKTLREPIGIISSENSVLNVPESIDELPSVKSTEHKTRALSATEEDDKENPIKLVTGGFIAENESDDAGDAQNSKFVDENDKQVANENKGAQAYQQPGKTTRKSDSGDHVTNKVERPRVQTVLSDARVRHLRDQLIRARVYLGLGATRNNPHYIKELRVRMKEVQRALGDASKDSDLPRNANDKLKAMEQVLATGKQIQDDCAAVIKKLRAILHSTEEQLRVHKKQTMFLTQLAAKTLPKGLHCVPLRLSTEYYSLNSDQQQFPNQEKLEDPSLFHYALFSDNILAAAVVVNSTVSHAKDPAKHVFHIVTDRLNYAAMRMWFLANLPSQATIQVQNIEEFTWLNASYSPVLKQLGSPSMIDYYFKADRAKSDSNLKFRNPKYLSILNHLRFYLPEIFPKLNKVLFVDDDIVVQKDLSGLWSIDLKGNVNGAVETCGESFHRFDRYLDFSNPLISKNFDPHACGWAYGMNIFDLDEWKKQNRTEVYHSWQRLNHDRQLWKLGTLPPGLITFWKSTFPLHRSWHVLGLGYNPSVGQKEIDRAAVIHYNGNMKPWLEIGMPKYRNYWARFINYEQAFLRDCNINP